MTCYMDLSCPWNVILMYCFGVRACKTFNKNSSSEELIQFSHGPCSEVAVFLAGLIVSVICVIMTTLLSWPPLMRRFVTVSSVTVSLLPVGVIMSTSRHAVRGHQDPPFASITIHVVGITTYSQSALMHLFK